MLNLNIMGFKVVVHSKEMTILSRLKMDFEFFLNDGSRAPDLEIKVESVERLPAHFVPANLRPLFQRHNSITYEKNGVRYNDYYGSVLSQFVARTGTAHIVGIDLEKIYEVTYLLILSRSGKDLDQRGLHKIHAFSVSKNGRAVICMQPMRGGKSTLFAHLLMNADVEIISDDTPLLDSSGTLRAFPLRVSLDKVPPGLSLNEEDHYLMKREFYKDKYSISLRAFKRPLSPPVMNYFFVEAHRSSFDSPKIEKMSRLRLLSRLVHHMVIGIGLPMIFEYFWETGRQDLWVKTRIFFSRFSLAVRLALTKQGHDLYLCNDVKKNAAAILDLMENPYR